MGVVAPYFQSEGSAVPYVGLQEVKFSPTASAVDLTNLIPNASQTVQDRALYELIVRASSMADTFVYGRLGTFSATVNTENGRYRPNRYGQIIVNPSFTPILEVQTFNYGTQPGQATNVPLSTYNCSIERDEFIITAANGLNATTIYGSLSIVGGQWAYNTELFCQYTYVNGFPNAFLAANASSGATTLSLTSTVGIYAGTQLSIWDGMNDENVTVASVSGNVITLSAATQHAHGVGTNISNLPAEIKQAVIHFIVGMIRERGQGGLVLNEIGEPVVAPSRSTTGEGELMLGYDLLEPYKRLWGRA
jgi:hypothetical protein